MSTFAFEKQMKIAKAQAEARTMFEVMKASDKEGLAKILCDLHAECDTCPAIARENCWSKHNGFLTWLDQKEEINFINLMKEDLNK